jgi:F-type H+-transporting ATPase subunit gamma
MANLRAIRKRIASVKNTRQITKAMKLVSGAKLKRATEAVIAARPYNRKLKGILDNLLATMEELDHPLFRVPEKVERVKIVVFGSDRGLCGSFNSTINRRLDALIRNDFAGKEVELITVGRKSRDHARRQGYKVVQEYSNLAPASFATVAREVVVGLVKDFEEGHVDLVVLLYNQFRSAISQEVTTENLVPLTPPVKKDDAAQTALTDFIYEPSQAAILDALLPQLVTARALQAFLESTASEHGSRMSAMDNATRNASEMIEKLTLEYNRARQAAITKELVEIVSGAEAL